MGAREETERGSEIVDRGGAREENEIEGGSERGDREGERGG